MMKWLVLLALLPASAWAQVYDTIGQKAADASLAVSLNVGVWGIKDTANMVYTAGKIDSVWTLGVWTEGITSVEIGIYRWQQGADTPTTRYYLDTLSRSSANSWDSLVLSPKVGLEPDTSYVVAVCALAGTTLLFKRITGPSNSIGEDATSPVKLSANYTADDEGFGGLLAAYAIVRSYSGWGGVDLRTAADMKATFIRNDQPTINNGAGVTGSVGNGSPSTQVYKNYLLSTASDLRHAGWTQDSAVAWLYYDESDTGQIYGYVLKVPWGEGNEAGATADSGDCDWTAAFTKNDANDSIPWGAAGATGSADRQTTPCCSLTINTADVAGYKRFHIAGSHVTADFANYGIVFERGAMASTFLTFNFATDDRSTVANRPYIVGYETAPAGGQLPKRKRKAQ